MIEKYDFGVVHVDGKEYRRDVIIYPLDPFDKLPSTPLRAGGASSAPFDCAQGGRGRAEGARGSTRVDDTWWRKDGHRLDPADLEQVVKAKPEVLVVGTGYHGCMQVPKETIEFLKNVGIELYAERTEQACQKYNELRDIRKVVAALHLTC